MSSTPNEMNLELLEAFFEDSRDVLEEWERVTLALTPDDGIKGYEPILRCAHNLKGSAGLMGLSILHKQMHEIEDRLVKLRELGRGPDEAVIAAFLETERMLRRWMEHLKVNTAHVEDTRVALSMLTGLVDGESAAAPGKKDSGPQRSDRPIDPSSLAQMRTDGGRGEETLRIAAGKLDQVIQLVGELSLHQAILDRASRENNLQTEEIRSVIDLKTKLTQDLQDAALSLRMIPVQGLFQKIERVARETASKLDKKVQVNRRGEDVSLDKLVVDGMLDPLIHIARNAVDHGIEPSKNRIESGKNPFGTISISAENSAAGVTIVFQDDGAGIDAEKIYRKAVDKGLVAVDEATTFEQKLQLIFAPGLSSLDTATEYSGRGVGMDVVAEAVKHMGGRVEVESKRGEGTTFTINLPTNFSIIDAIVIKVHGCQYAIPNQDLAEVLDLHDFNIQPVDGGETRVIDLRGRIVPVENLASFLDQPGALEANSGDQTVAILNAGKGRKLRPAVIVNYRDERLALAVDKVVGQQQIFVRPIIGHLAPIGFYGGSTILSDGEPTIILNLPEIARRYFTSH